MPWGCGLECGSWVVLGVDRVVLAVFGGTILRLSELGGSNTCLRPRRFSITKMKILFIVT
jgi:hypothetical protein